MEDQDKDWPAWVTLAFGAMLFGAVIFADPLIAWLGS